MKLSTLILDRIITDVTFSRDLSAALGIKQNSVEDAAKRAKNNESPGFSLARPAAIIFYTQSGYSIEEIYEDTKPAK